MKMAYSKDNVVKGALDMDKVRLEKDQVGRYALLEQAAVAEISHFVQLPKLADGKNDPNGGYYVCLGDRETMRDESGKISPDPDNCPFCAVGLKNDDVSPPRYKFATNVWEYMTNSRGEPVSDDGAMGMVKIWVFNQRNFNDVVAKKEQWGDLRNHDISFTCTSAQYKTVKLDVLKKALWKTNPQKVAEVFKKNKADDLIVVLGRKLSKDRMELFIKKYSLGDVTPEEQDAALPVEEPQVSAAEVLGEEVVGNVDDEGEGGGDPKVLEKTQEEKAPEEEEPSAESLLDL
jgi:hypothetical protein